MTCWESYYIQIYQQQYLLTEEQSLGKLNLLYDILCDIPLQCACIQVKCSAILLVYNSA